MIEVNVVLPMLTPSQVNATEAELRRKRIPFSVLHDRKKRESRYVLTVRSDADVWSLPKVITAKLGVAR